MKIRIRIVFLLLIPLIVTCIRNPAGPPEYRITRSFRPVISSNSPLLLGKPGFMVTVFDSVPNPDEKYINYLYITTSLGDYETEKLSTQGFLGDPMRPGGFYPYAGMPVVESKTYTKKDSVIQIPPKHKGGWLLVKYRSKFNGEFYFYRFSWGVEQRR